MKETSKHYLEALHMSAFDNLDLYSARIVLARTLNYLLTLSHQEQIVILQDSLLKASEKLKVGEDFSLYLVDRTQAGGAHEVKVLFKVSENIAIIQVPAEPDSENGKSNSGIKGGRFPTVCHGIEMVAAVYKTAREIFPEICFVPSSEFDDNVLTRPLLIPLTLDPANTNLVIFHTQSRSIDPYTLAQGWYEIMKIDEQLAEDPLRHTILVMPKSNSDGNDNPHFESDQPQNKKTVHIEVLPKEMAEDRTRFRPMHLNRISRWNGNGQTTDGPKPTVARDGARYIMSIG